MLLEIGVGDAYGACFEFCNRKFVEQNNHLLYCNHPRNLRKNLEDGHSTLVQVGRYTDDTQMSLAVAEAMLDENELWTKESLADRFVEVFKRDQRRGYTTYFLNVLMNSQDGKEMLSKIGGKSTKSGGLMRAGVIGLYADFDEVVVKAEAQASVTHDSWLGMNSAVGAALMTHYFYHKLGPKEKLCEWLKTEYFGDTIHVTNRFEVDGEVVECWSPDYGSQVRCHAWDCLEAAIYAIESHSTMSGILQQCVAYTGDVDTVAAIVMGPASCSEEIHQDLPIELIKGLENNSYGKDYLLELDLKLYSKFPRRKDATKDFGKV